MSLPFLKYPMKFGAASNLRNPQKFNHFLLFCILPTDLVYALAAVSVRGQMTSAIFLARVDNITIHFIRLMLKLTNKRSMSIDSFVAHCFIA